MTEFLNLCRQANAFVALLWWMTCLHFLFDYALQTDFIARGKNPKAPIPGIPWPWVLAAHAGMQGFGVTLATGSTLLGVFELAVHWATDYAKCSGWFGPDPERAFDIDQWIHLGCKLLWAVLFSCGIR